MDVCVEEKAGIEGCLEAGREDAFAAVGAVLAHGEKLRRIAAGLGLCGADIDDVLQEVGMRAVNGAVRFTSEDHAMAWAARVTINLCMLERRKGLRFRRAAKGVFERLRRRGRAHNPQVAAIRREEIEAVRRTLARLDETLLAPMVLRYFGGLDSGQIAEALGTKASTVRARLRKARMTLAKELLDMGIDA